MAIPNQTQRPKTMLSDAEIRANQQAVLDAEKAEQDALDAQEAREAAERAAALAAGSDDVPEFKFRQGRRLPEGFVNPPCGDPEHKCVDFRGLYAPKWKQLRIAKFHDHQRNPQTVGCADQTYNIPLEKWVDVPPEVINSLMDAVETVHEQVVTREDVTTGSRPQRVSSTRPRFMYQVLGSA